MKCKFLIDYIHYKNVNLLAKVLMKCIYINEQRELRLISTYKTVNIVFNQK